MPKSTPKWRKQVFLVKEVNDKEVDKVKNVNIFEFRTQYRSYVPSFIEIAAKIKIFVKEVNKKTSFALFFLIQK